MKVIPESWELRGNAYCQTVLAQYHCSVLISSNSSLSFLMYLASLFLLSSVKYCTYSVLQHKFLPHRSGVIF